MTTHTTARGDTSYRHSADTRLSCPPPAYGLYAFIVSDITQRTVPHGSAVSQKTRSQHQPAVSSNAG